MLCPWTTSSRRQHGAKDHSLPLGYYWVVRGWHTPTILDVLAKGMTKLQLDVAHGRTDEVRRRVAEMMEAGAGGGGADADSAADVDLAERSKPYRASLLHLAVYSGEYELLEFLLSLRSAQLPVSSLDCFDRSALMYAACKEEPEMARLLLRHRCEPNLQDREGRTALHIGAAMGHVGTLAALLEEGGEGAGAGAGAADPMTADACRNTCVHYAALEAREAALTLLLASPRARPALAWRNVDELLPLHQSAGTGDARCVAALLQADGGGAAVIDERVREEGTSTHIACEKGHAEVLRALLRSGADLEAHVAPQEDPRTPLHLAAEHARLRWKSRPTPQVALLSGQGLLLQWPCAPPPHSHRGLICALLTLPCRLAGTRTRSASRCCCRTAPTCSPSCRAPSCSSSRTTDCSRTTSSAPRATRRRSRSTSRTRGGRTAWRCSTRRSPSGAAARRTR